MAFLSLIDPPEALVVSDLLGVAGIVDRISDEAVTKY